MPENSTLVRVATPITVRVIARGGKFLGDDIGGAEVTIRDVRAGVLMATGRTHGGSGPATVMTAALTRTQPIPTQAPGNDACRFDVTLTLAEPRLIEISAYGPLAAQESANRVTATTWIYPGKGFSPGQKGEREDGFLLEIPGLLVQAMLPPAHFLPYQPNPQQVIQIRANVTMMCGCPIAPNPWHGSPSVWPTTDFEVSAVVESAAGASTFPLQFDPAAPEGVPSQFFTNAWTPGAFGVYQITIFAYQKSTGNTGVDRTTVNLVAP